MHRLLTLQYYFTPLPDPNFQYTKFTLILGILLIVLGIALSIYRRKYIKDPINKKILKKYPGLLRTYGILVLILLLVRETGIPYLSMRIWWFVVAIFFLYSLIKFLLNYKREYKLRLKRVQKNQVKGKYLPKKKK